MVLEAQHVTLTNKRVAPKHLHEGYRDHAVLVERFIREAQTANALEHPHIVQILDVEHDEELGPVLVMEGLEGEGLDEVRNRGSMPWDRACRIVAQALDALELAHLVGIVHRDLKPANLFLSQRDGEDRVKVVDFGIAHVAGEAGLTQTGHFYGTPRYAAPEQRLDASRVGPEADVYAMGITLIELIKGDRATVEMIGGIHTKVVIDLDETQCPGGVRDVIARATELDPEERYLDAAAMRVALVRALSDLGAASLPPPPARSAAIPRPPWRAAHRPRVQRTSRRPRS